MNVQRDDTVTGPLPGATAPGDGPVSERNAPVRVQRVLATLAVLLLLVLAAQVSIQRIRSFDYWQHLRTGALIAETGSVPRTDPYTYTVLGARWIDPHWLHQLGVYGLFSAGGHDAVVFGKLALVLAVLALLAPIGWRRARPAVTLLGLALLLVVASNRVMPRPELPTFVLLATQLLLLDRWLRHGGRALWLVVPLQLVWVNLHGLFAVGLAVLALVLGGELVRPLPPFRQPVAWRRVRQLAAVLALSALVSPLNPNGLEGLLLPLQQLAQVATPGFRAAAGIQAVEFESPLTAWRVMPPLGLVFLGLLGVFASSGLLLNLRRAHPGDVLLLAAFVTLALAALRNWGLFAVVAAPLGVRHWNAVLDRRAPAPRLRLAGTALVALALTAVVADAARGRFFARIGSVREAGLGVMRGLYPIRAAQWVAREQPPGPLFHHMADGAYLIWRLYPDYPVLLDGRLEQVFRAADVRRLHRTDPEGFEELDRRYRFGTALLHYNQFDLAPLVRSLHHSPRWRLVFADGIAVVFVRQPAARRWRELHVDAPNLFPPLAGPPGPSDMAERLGRSQLYAILGRPARAHRLLAETIELYPRDVPAALRRTFER